MEDSFLQTQRMSVGTDGLAEYVVEWLRIQEVTFFEKGNQKLVPRHDKCLYLCDTHVKKLLDYVSKLCVY